MKFHLRSFLIYSISKTSLWRVCCFFSTLSNVLSIASEVSIIFFPHNSKFFHFPTTSLLLTNWRSSNIKLLGNYNGFSSVIIHHKLSKVESLNSVAFSLFWSSWHHFSAKFAAIYEIFWFELRKNEAIKKISTGRLGSE